MSFEPLMSLYLTDNLAPEEIVRAKQAGVVAVKLYPAGATTNSAAGVSDIRKTYRTLEAMQREGMLLLVHGEVTDPAVDIFDREAVFMEQSLLPLLRDHQGLKVVVEHVTTAETLDIVRAHAPRVGGTITPHHLIINRTSLFQGGLRPHYYCLPVAKRERHRLALRKAVTSGDSCFFIGTDTAPHLASLKEAACGCAGVFVGATALQTYTQVFDEEGALDRLEKFASLNGANFYGLPVNTGTIQLKRQSVPMPTSIAVDGGDIVVFRGDEALPWSIGEVKP